MRKVRFTRLSLMGGSDAAEVIMVQLMNGNDLLYEFRINWHRVKDIHSVMEGDSGLLMSVHIYADAFAMFTAPEFKQLRQWFAGLGGLSPLPSATMQCFSSFGWEDDSRKHWTECRKPWVDPV